MAEQFADLVERSAFPKQIGRQCVAEEMCAFASRIDASADQRPPDDCGDCDGVCETTNGSSMSKEHMTADTARTARAQVDCDRFTNVGRQRQLCPTPTLAANGDPTVVPIDVVQAQRNDLAGTQTQVGRAAIERRSSAFHPGCHARSDRGHVALCQQAETSARWKGTKRPPVARIPPSRWKSLPGVASSAGKIEERSPATWHGQGSTGGRGLAGTL